MTTYTVLTEDEKAQIRLATLRNLEYQMYSAEVSLLVENAKSTPDAAKVSEIQSAIADFQTQIAAL
jgi:hypothetical protein